MQKLNKYFWRHEFKCPCCEKDTVDYLLFQILATAREDFGKPVRISKGGGCRCQPYNRTIKGFILNSQHIYCKASDFTVDEIIQNILLTTNH